MTFEGKRLWQSGEPGLWQRLTSDVACQIHDLDHDGKDEFAIGYSLLRHDGRIIWSLDQKLQDHADAVAVVKLHPNDPEPTFFCAASDEGVFWADLKSNVLVGVRPWVQ